MREEDPDKAFGPEPANLRFLRRLVTVLTLVMIGGLVTVISLLVIRLQAPVLPVLPDTISLPEGVTPQAVTFGAGWVAVVAGDRILVFDAETGAVLQDVAVDGTR